MFLLLWMVMHERYQTECVIVYIHFCSLFVIGLIWLFKKYKFFTQVSLAYNRSLSISFETETNTLSQHCITYFLNCIHSGE